MELHDSLKSHFRLTSGQEKALGKLGITNVEHLLHHFPARYSDTAEATTIGNLEKGSHAVVFGQISGLKTSKAFRKKIPMAEGVVTDGTGKIKIVWFHQAYLAKMISEGSFVRVEGKVAERPVRPAQGKQNILYFSNPQIEITATLFEPGSDHSFYPIYPESRGVTSNWIHHKVRHILASSILDHIGDPIPEDILKTYKLPNLRTSLIYIHTPKTKNHAEAARKRFAFQEIFFIQLERQRAKKFFQEQNAFTIEKTRDDIEPLIERFPFTPTQAQEKTIGEMLKDLASGRPMSRLLEGDVGSGKTAVAAAVTYAVVTSKPFDKTQNRLQTYGSLQTAYMAPTEILAQQHFESFIKYFKHLPINFALITGSGCRKFPSKVYGPANGGVNWTDISRSQLLKWVSNGEIAVVIGTHALIQKSVKFKHLALAIIDEQHRFGVEQRKKLVSKNEITPHLLSMTATPIPRTLALTLYGDLDLSLLDEMPLGRKAIKTSVINPSERSDAYERIREELKSGRQLYVICPRIDEPDPEKELAVQAKSVKAEAKRLKQEIFPEYSIEILHSKMKTVDKEKVMLDFKEHKFDILVSTSVVEVGVNVENASLIIIEGAERFGLSQLHQLRGRVLRGTHQPYCFVFSETKGEKAEERLEALLNAKNGFELAEFDLAQRGAGLLSGTKQWGISDLGMEAIKNIKMVEIARNEASRIVETDPDFKNHPEIQKHLDLSHSKKIHFE